MRSLEKYPLRLETGADCRILFGFGEKICQMVDQRLSKTNAAKPIFKTVSTGDLEQKRPAVTTTMVDLSDQEREGEHSDPDVNPPPAKQMKRTAQPKKTSKAITKTTSAGPALFNNPSSSIVGPTTISTLLGISTSPPSQSKTRAPPVQVLRPGSFRILLCIDNAEASRSTQKVLLENLKKAAIDYDVRKLNIGDFLWIVRRKLCFIGQNLTLTFSHHHFE